MKSKASPDALFIQTALYLSFANDTFGWFHYSLFPSSVFSGIEPEVSLSRLEANAHAVFAQLEILQSMKMQFDSPNYCGESMEALMKKMPTALVQIRELKRYEASLQAAWKEGFPAKSSADTQLCQLLKVSNQTKIEAFLAELLPSDSPFTSDALLNLSVEAIVRRKAQADVSELKSKVDELTRIYQRVASQPFVRALINGKVSTEAVRAFTTKFEEACVEIYKETQKAAKRAASNYDDFMPQTGIENMIDTTHEYGLFKLYDQISMRYFDDTQGIEALIVTIFKSLIIDCAQKKGNHNCPLENTETFTHRVTTVQDIGFVDMKLLLEKCLLPTADSLSATIERCIDYFQENFCEVKLWREGGEFNRHRLSILLAIIDGNILDDQGSVLNQEQMADLLDITRRTYISYLLKGRVKLKIELGYEL